MLVISRMLTSLLVLFLLSGVLGPVQPAPFRCRTFDNLKYFDFMLLHGIPDYNQDYRIRSHLFGWNYLTDTDRRYLDNLIAARAYAEKNKVQNVVKDDPEDILETSSDKHQLQIVLQDVSDSQKQLKMKTEYSFSSGSDLQEESSPGPRKSPNSDDTTNKSELDGIDLNDVQITIRAEMEEVGTTDEVEMENATENVAATTGSTAEQVEYSMIDEIMMEEVEVLEDDTTDIELFESEEDSADINVDGESDIEYNIDDLPIIPEPTANIIEKEDNPDTIDNDNNASSDDTDYKGISLKDWIEKLENEKTTDYVENYDSYDDYLYDDYW